jgi:hypothetical protein
MSHSPNYTETVTRRPRTPSQEYPGPLPRHASQADLSIASAGSTNSLPPQHQHATHALQSRRQTPSGRRCKAVRGRRLGAHPKSGAAAPTSTTLPRANHRSHRPKHNSTMMSPRGETTPERRHHPIRGSRVSPGASERRWEQSFSDAFKKGMAPRRHHHRLRHSREQGFHPGCSTGLHAQNVTSERPRHPMS